METRVSVTVAAAQAWRNFCRYPVAFATPVVLVLSAAWLWTAASTLHGHKVGLLFGLTSGLLSFALNCIAYVLVCSMYLRARGGSTPLLGQVGEVVRYRGLAGYLWTLLARYLGWGLAALAVMAVALAAGFMVTMDRMALHKGSGLGAVAGGYTSTYVLILFLVAGAIATIIVSRYSLALPMFALAGGDKPGLWDESVRLARSIWSTVAAIALVALIPVAVELAIAHLGRNDSYSSSLLALLHLLRALFNGTWNAWFVILHMELALQLVPPVETARPDSFA